MVVDDPSFEEIINMISGSLMVTCIYNKKKTMQELGL